jgi:hypothetical protein
VLRVASKSSFEHFLRQNRADLPRLAPGEGYRVVDAASDRFNCFAWSTRDRQRWVYLDTFADCDAHFRQAGFIAAPPGEDGALDLSHSARREKAVVFGITPEAARRALRTSGAEYADATRVNFARAIVAGEPLPTHGVVQEPSGAWSSKMGDGPIIELEHPALLNGPVYGEPLRVYVRAVTGQPSRSAAASAPAAIEWY